MPARKNEPDTWWSQAEAEAAPASGGHIAPADATLADPLDDALLAEEEGSAERVPDRDPDRGERTEVIPTGALRGRELGRVATSARSRSRGKRSRPATRRVKRTLRHVDPFSVFKLSLMFYACFLLLWLAIVGIVYALLSSMGVFDAVEKLGRTAVLWKDLDISLWFVERWALFVGAAFAVVASLVNVFVAFVYNLAADVVGGMQMTFVERDV